MSIPSNHKHLVASAGDWYNAAQQPSTNTRLVDIGGCMESAYHHVENALAAALRQLHAIKGARDNKQQYHPPALEQAMDDAEDFLKGFPEFKP